MGRKQLELELEEAVCKYALSIGVINCKMKAAGERGWPDRQFFIPGGRPFFIEFKNGTVPSKQQEVIIRRLKHYGYDAEIHADYDQACQAIKTRLDAMAVSKSRR